MSTVAHPFGDLHFKEEVGAGIAFENEPPGGLRIRYDICNMKAEMGEMRYEIGDRGYEK